MSENGLRGFSGEVAEYYSRFRRGYPPRVVDALVDAFDLDHDDVVIDLGCGTGQLTLPLARRVHAAVGVDPEPDMLRLAAAAATTESVRNVSWVRGFDSDLPEIADRIGASAIGAITVATAIHWMNHVELFTAARSIVRPYGGVAVVTNGSPLWLQDSDWSRRLRTVLEDWTGREVRSSCGTDEDSRRAYRAAMATAGFTVHHATVDYEAELDIAEIIGGLFSAMPHADVADPVRRERFASEVRSALAPQTRFTEHVSVGIQSGVLTNPG
jgi:ubiquinone/menaquinone biosynthesis C-methylase UbiE